MSPPAPGPTRVERVFAGAYPAVETAVLTAAVASAGPPVAATGGGLAVAWTGPQAATPSPADLPRCVLDGEIYNLEDIARSAGVPAAAAPEAILAAAFARLGEALLKRVRGEFALLLWEPRTGTALLARDQLGYGGLFIHVDGGRLRFASELPYLLDTLPRAPSPDREALVQWLAEGTVGPDRTVYEGIVPQPPGSVLRLHDGRWESVRYWTPRFVGPNALDRDQAACELRSAVIGSVRRRLRGRRTAGILLSGGLDSGTVLGACALLASETDTSLRAYSAVFPAHRSMDESELIAVQVRHHGIPGSRRAFTGGSPLQGALRYLDRWRTPLPVPGLFVWEPLLDTAVRDGAECMFDGQLGDELFGAPALLLADQLRRSRLSAALRLARSFPGAGPSPSWRLMLSLLGHYGLAPFLPPGVARLASGRNAAPQWLSRPAARRYRRSVDPHPWRSLEGPRWWAQLSDAVIRAPDRIGFFDYFRRRGRAAGLPAYHPFLDLDLIDTVLSLPPEHGFDPGLSRPLLRSAMRGLVPEAVRLRSGKSYFNPLIVDGLARHDRGPITRLLTARNAEVLAIADAAGVRALLAGGPRAHPRGPGRWVHDVWRLATAECWLRSQADPGFSRSVLYENGAAECGERVRVRQAELRAAGSYVSPP